MIIIIESPSQQSRRGRDVEDVRRRGEEGGWRRKFVFYGESCGVAFCCPFRLTVRGDSGLFNV
jgi:hypothetical protein